MSEPKRISPLLDAFDVGAPMSEHHGVQCCPAMRRDSDEKYIIKVISIPASQVQLDALLLTGAYADSAAALEYFRRLSDDTVKQAQALEKLSKLEGFLPYQSWQVVQKEGEVGFDVYLLGTYKRSLEKFFKRETMTQLGAVNLGLDLCAAMAVCRHTGLLYVDLKPGNIFLSDDQEYRVGDLGFVSLNSLKYASLPERYRSSYTAPEMNDPMATLNATVDIYAIGLILYQAYNGGVLPQRAQAPDEPLPPPPYADYEMAEIILKACAPKPEDRWQSPAQMGQALVSYMQRNGANNVPIVPPPVEVNPSEPAQPEAPVEADDAALEQILSQQDISEALPDALEEESVAADAEDMQSVSDADAGVQDAEADISDLTFLDEMTSDETAPDDSTVTEAEYDELSDETSDILSQADDLIAHDAPGPVVAPEAIDVPIPPPVVLEDEEADTPEAADSPLDSECSDPAETPQQIETPPAEQTEPQLPDDEQAEIEEPEDEETALLRKRRKTRIRAMCVTLLVLAILALGAFAFYRFYYLVPVNSLALTGTESRLTVEVSADIDESLLSVVCKDTHGNAVTVPVKDGRAVVENLNPNTQYQITLSVSGVHKLTGNTTANYNTPVQTNIVQFNATTGTEDGSVILKFYVDGKQPDEWRLLYGTEGEQEKSLTITSNMATVKGLTVGKQYTFRLTSETPLYIVGQSEITYTAAKIVYAQDIHLDAYDDGNLSVSWRAPEGVVVEGWTAHCYGGDNFDQSIDVTEPRAAFTGLDPTKEYTVDVVANGMAIGSHIYVPANPINVTAFTADTTNPAKLSLTWSHTGDAPKGGWLLLYTVDGGDQQVARCEGTTASIAPMVPNADYAFTLQAADGANIFGGTLEVQTPDAPEYDSDVYNISASKIYPEMCRTPDVADWDYYDLSGSDYTNTFRVGEKASFLLTVYSYYNYDSTDIVTMFVIRDAQGKLVSYDTSVRPFREMWYNSRCELDIPNMPATPGEYTISVYFDGAKAFDDTFTVTSET